MKRRFLLAAVATRFIRCGKPGYFANTRISRCGDAMGQLLRERVRVPYELVAAIIDVESGWQPNVVSAKGAVGLMQLMPATAYQFGVHNRFRIEENLQGGVAYLARLMRRFGGDLRLVAAAYYAGEKRIATLGLECGDPDVYRYVAAVEREYQLHRKGIGKP
jgi:Transglycosylase SLT domain